MSLIHAARAGGRPIQLGSAVAVAVLTLVPAGYVLAGVLAGHDTARLLWRPRVGELLTNTVLLVTLGTAACVTVGTLAAWLVERTTLRGRPVWTALMLAPLAVPAFVNSFAWYSLSPSFAGLGAALLVTTLSYYPLVYLPVAAMLRGLDPALEEQSRMLGNGPYRTFRRVVVPQLRPALSGGALLVALHLLAEFGALEALRFDTFTTAIYDQYQSTFNGSAATALAGVLIPLCLLLLGAERALSGGAPLMRVGGGVARQVIRYPLGRTAPGVLAGLVLLTAAALGVPLGCIAWWLLTSTSAEFPAAELLQTASTSIVLALLGAAVTTTLAFPVAWLSVRRRGRFSQIVERSTYLGNSLPGIVVALALVTIAARHLPSLYQSTAMLLAAYAVLFMPRAMVSLRAVLKQTPPELGDVGRSLGVGPAGVLSRVTLPLIARGVATGAALVSLAITTELTSTLLLAPIGTRTLATQFWSASTSINYGQAAPYALLMILISVPAAYLLTRRKEGAGR
ncbi:iron ABC transporter permease [Planotetraspora phitsanulokensis]|uniref:Iron ABC transporter permease n=1 Tax=Planotetraspora phitsanulokensis TaxID=575192 RepID=A0A8J3TZX8_9ACTN|nr:iron ABC transporter permease [Planotetraspora phitsanulokensis]GII36083.1 iron ABC transporter permease [Planotetraspora phitsanulokensis]